MWHWEEFLLWFVFFTSSSISLSKNKASVDFTRNDTKQKFIIMFSFFTRNTRIQKRVSKGSKRLQKKCISESLQQEEVEQKMQMRKWHTKH